MSILFYMRENCRLCDEADVLLDILSHEYSFTVEKRNIDTNDEWLEKYQVIIPVIKIGETTLNCNTVNYDTLEQALKKIENN